MSTADWTNFAAALAGVVGVAIPILLRRLEKRDRLARASYLLKLHGTHAELEALIAADADGLSSTGMGKEMAALAKEMREEIEGTVERNPFRLFLALAMLESFLFLGFAFLELSEFLAKALKGRSYESGIYFLEGIWGSPLARTALIVLCIAAAVGITLRLAERITQRVGSTVLKNLLLLASFNGVLLVVTIFLAAALAALDPFVKLW